MVLKQVLQWQEFSDRVDQKRRRLGVKRNKKGKRRGKEGREGKWSERREEGRKEGRG